MKIKSSRSVSIIGGADGPTSVFIAGKKQKKSLKVRVVGYIYKCKRKRVEKSITAKPHTLEEVVKYAISKYNALELDSEDFRVIECKNNHKGALIMKHKPELLGEFRDIKRPDEYTQETIKEMIKQMDRRSEMIAAMPDDVLPMDFHVYEIKIKDGCLEMEIDFKWDILSISYSGKHKTMKEMSKISRDLHMYYGVSENDIKNKTQRYSSMICALSS